jgi:phage antirepressor YoqD-like protein
MNNLPVVAGVPVNTDDQGRFNLNALHRASGGESHKKPSEWIRTKQSKDLVKELSVNSRLGQNAINSVRGGSSPGTYAHELLAISYAGWISPAFQLKVNQVFLDYRSGKLQESKVKTLSRHEILKIAMEAEEENIRLKSLIAVNSEAVEFAHALRISEGSVGLSTAAKLLNTSASKLQSVLVSLEWIGSDLMPSQQKIDEGILQLRLVGPDDQNNIQPDTNITGQGLSALFDAFKSPSNKKLLGCDE